MSQGIDIVIGAQDKASAMIDGIAAKAGAKLNSGLASIGKKFVAIAGAAAIAAAATKAFSATLDAVNEARAELDELAKSARGVGETTANLRSFAFAMGEFTGLDTKQATLGLQQLQRAIGEATDGNQGKLDVFERLKLDARELSMQGPVEQFRRVREALQGVGTTSQIASNAQQLLGRAAKDMVPALLAGSDAFDESMNAAKDLGLTISEEGAAGIEAMNDALGRAGAAFEGMANQLAVQVAPAVTEIALTFAEWVPPLLELSKEILPDVVDTIVTIGAYAYDVGKILVAASTGDIFGLNEAIQNFGTASELLDGIDARRRAAQQAAIDNLVKRRQLMEVMAGLDDASVDAEEAKQTEAEKSIEALQRKLKVMQYGEELVKQQEQLATATNDAERERIKLLQDLIAKQSEHNDLVKANGEAVKQQEDEIAKKREEFAKDQAQIDEGLASFTAGTSATESRLLTRGPQQKGIDKIADYTEQTVSTLERMETLLEQTKQNANTVELEFVG